MQRRKVLLGGALIAVAALIPGIAVASGSDDDGAEIPITGRALERASSAALEYLGQGAVTQTEVGDEESYYEVEVTLSDGTQIDVQLDEAFNVVGSEADGTDDD